MAELPSGRPFRPTVAAQSVFPVSAPGAVPELRQRLPSILIGHSAGGAFTQILLDHGYGAAGVALNSAPTEGVPVVPLSQIKSTFPVLKNPANRHKGHRLLVRAVELCVHQHPARGGGSCALRPLRGSGVGTDSLRERTGQPDAGTPGHLGQLPQRRSRSTAVRRGYRGQHHAAEGAVVKRETLQVE